MADNAPFEIIAAPMTVYWAPTGEAFPAIEDTPAGNWVSIGTNGDRNIKEAGVTITHEETVNLFRVVGSTGPVKALRTDEALRIALEIADLSLENYRHGLNRNAVTDVAAGGGAAGYRHVDLYMNHDVTQYALLLRSSYSPYGASWNSQYEIPVAVQIGSPSPIFEKGEPAGIALEFIALEDPDAATVGVRFGRLLSQDAAVV